MSVSRRGFMASGLLMGLFPAAQEMKTPTCIKTSKKMEAPSGWRYEAWTEFNRGQYWRYHNFFRDHPDGTCSTCGFLLPFEAYNAIACRGRGWLFFKEELLARWDEKTGLFDPHNIFQIKHDSKMRPVFSPFLKKRHPDILLILRTTLG